jgi:hypothetical protein
MPAPPSHRPAGSAVCAPGRLPVGVNGDGNGCRRDSTRNSSLLDPLLQWWRSCSGRICSTCALVLRLFQGIRQGTKIFRSFAYDLWCGLMISINS